MRWEPLLADCKKISAWTELRRMIRAAFAWIVGGEQ